MTDRVEFYATTVDDAVEKAALELDLSSAEVSYRVLDEGNSGFLGIGARDARIVVEVPAHRTSGEEDEPLEPTAEENALVNEPEPAPSENTGSSTLSEVYGDQSEPDQVVAPEELL